MSELLEATVELDDGETVSIKFTSLNLLPIGLLRRTRNDEQEQVWATLEWALDPESLTLLDELPATQLMAVLDEMQKVSQANLGKSGSSSPSSKTTARRSKRTSSPSDSD